MRISPIVFFSSRNLSGGSADFNSMFGRRRGFPGDSPKNVKRLGSGAAAAAVSPGDTAAAAAPEQKERFLEDQA